MIEWKTRRGGRERAREREKKRERERERERERDQHDAEECTAAKNKQEHPLRWLGHTSELCASLLDVEAVLLHAQQHLADALPGDLVLARGPAQLLLCTEEHRRDRVQPWQHLLVRPPSGPTTIGRIQVRKQLVDALAADLSHQDFHAWWQHIVLFRTRTFQTCMRK